MKALNVKKGLITWLIILCVFPVMAQEITVNGYITDSFTKKALSGVAVMVVGKNGSTLSDKYGKYNITAEKGNILLFSKSGYQAKKAKVKMPDINISLDYEIVEEKVALQHTPTAKQMVMVCYDMASPIRVNTRGNIRILENTEEYSTITENRFKSVSKDPLSTFSIDVDAASYSNMRRFINKGQMPPKDALRTEELVNYFTYNYPQPTGSDPVKITTEAGICPWNTAHRLVRIGLKVKEIPTENLPVSNLVFLIDVSGSMYGPERLELVKSSLKLLINNLREKDRVSIVVYAGAAGEVLPSTSGNNKQKMREALDNLTAGGSTAGGDGIKLAYKIAKKNFISGGNNRIILCTDGDFNVGVSNTNELERLIEKERKSGIFLTVLGYGMGNYKDNKMQVLAEKGNGNHAYIDNLQEANKILVNEFGGTIVTVAKDVKLQVEFNPAKVQSYRLIGYESRLLNNEDFNDDTKDAGEMGAGHTVTALYEVVPAGVKENVPGKVDDLKYQQISTPKSLLTNSPELLTIKLRYKKPDNETSQKIEAVLIDDGKDSVSGDFRFASAVAMFGQLLRDSDFKGSASFEKVISCAGKGLENDQQGYRREFIRIAETAKGISK